MSWTRFVFSISVFLKTSPHLKLKAASKNRLNPGVYNKNAIDVQPLGVRSQWCFQLAERKGFEPLCAFAQTDFELESLSGL